MDIASIELEPLSSGSSGSPRWPARATRVTRWVTIGLAVAATGTLGVLVVRNDAQTQSSIDQPRVEQPATALPLAAADPTAAVAVERYQACLPGGAGSADALERQAERCLRELEHAVFPGDRSDPCVPRGAGSADGLERWVEHCHRAVLGAVLAPSTVGG